MCRTSRSLSARVPEKCPFQLPKLYCKGSALEGVGRGAEWAYLLYPSHVQTPEAKTAFNRAACCLPALWFCDTPCSVVRPGIDTTCCPADRIAAVLSPCEARAGAGDMVVTKEDEVPAPWSCSQVDGNEKLPCGQLNSRPLFLGDMPYLQIYFKTIPFSWTLMTLFYPSQHPPLNWSTFHSYLPPTQCQQED